ncbi:SDR family NAD(P)-dependent oxidoreductase [Xanthomonas hortorum]|uniref:SDR family NAD(P)-dependent oxidoreductase n=1 Tax=Xanthomonas hortorum TaxID=56454 RepID=UPI001C3C28B0|nr:SDR family oxidoreductase [Xanthomonas hortorum]
MKTIGLQSCLKAKIQATSPTTHRAITMPSNNTDWVLITGASSGFGEEFARQYAAKGHPLILVARRLDRLQVLATTLRHEHGVEIITEQVDLSEVTAIATLHSSLRERGIEVEILINNAGHGLQGTFLDTSLQSTLDMVQLDIASLTVMTRLFGAEMRQRGHGRILLVASLLALWGVEDMAVYGASKAYVLRLGDALYREFKRDGVTVTSLCPGMSNTGFAQAAQQKITLGLKLAMMQPAPVVRAGIRALHKGRISIVPGLGNKISAAMIWATPRWLHQPLFARVMND